MSHFVVMVVGDVDKQLAPFDESLKVAPYRVPVSEEDLEDMLSFYKDKNFPFTSNIDECYAKYGQNWNNNKWQKDEKGWFYVSERNPKSKWDWYTIGGRFSGSFITILKNVENPNQRVDSIKKKYIDLDAIRAKEAEDARAEYQSVANCFPDGKIPRIEYKWTDVLKMDKLKTCQEKMKFYFSQENVKTFNQNTENITSGTIEMYQCTEDEFVAERTASAFQPFAIVKDGIWYERAKMGWWAITSDEKSPQEWTEIFEKIWNEIDDDETITFVDCHI